MSYCKLQTAQTNNFFRITETELSAKLFETSNLNQPQDKLNTLPTDLMRNEENIRSVPDVYRMLTVNLCGRNYCSLAPIQGTIAVIVSRTCGDV
jgi:hypothetical protein